MFKKLLSNLPFNPSLVSQVGFYAKRLHQEAWLRSLGLILVGVTLFIQIFAVAAPPGHSLQISGNDLIPGGFTSRDAAVIRCARNDYGYRDILLHYQINCNNVANSQTITLKSTDYNRQLYSMGRIPYGKAGEYAVQIAGSTYYMRFLWGWDRGIPYSTYKALHGIKDDGTEFFLLYNCGNLVIIGKPSPPPPLPPPPPPVDVCPKIPGPQTKPDQCDVCKKVPGIQTRPEQCDVCKEIPGEQSDTKQCVPCKKASSPTDKTACMVLHKHAKNITQNITNADGTTAKPDDVIEYTLSVKNTSVLTVKNYVFEEDMEDVLEYAAIVDAHGGRLTTKKVLTWPGIDIAPKATATKLITIKIKNPLPQTPTPPSNPASYDLVMTNVFGDAVEIKLPPTPTKTTEQVVQTLPNTGPSGGVMISVMLVVVFGYFFARTRLMAKELDIAKQGLDVGEL